MSLEFFAKKDNLVSKVELLELIKFALIGEIFMNFITVFAEHNFKTSLLLEETFVKL